MSIVRWDGVRFALPDEVIDETVLTFVDRSAGPSLSVTVSQEALESGDNPAAALLRYVDAQVKDIRAQAAGFDVVTQTERRVGGRPGLQLQATVSMPGAKRSQHQLYVLVEGRVIIAVVTTHEAQDARARAIVDQLASTFAVDPPLAPVA